METIKINTKIVDSYIELLNSLSTDNKLDIIERLTASIKIDLKNKNSSFKKSFGAFESDKSAEEIIKEIRDSRVSSSEIESF